MRSFVLVVLISAVPILMCYDCLARAEPAPVSASCCGGLNDECCGCFQSIGKPTYYLQFGQSSYNACVPAPDNTFTCYPFDVVCVDGNVMKYLGRTGTGCSSTCDTPSGLVNVTHTSYSCSSDSCD